jgi:hypothetical protein
MLATAVTNATAVMQATAVAPSQATARMRITTSPATAGTREQQKQ